MKNLQEKLANVQIEKLEERKEFTFYFCNPNPCNPTPPCNPTTPTLPTPPNPGNGGGGGWGGL